MAVRGAIRGAPAEKEIGPIGKQLGLDPGDLVKSITGVLVAVYDPKEFGTAPKQFTIQNCDLEMSEINGKSLDEVLKVRLAIFNEELPKNWKDTEIFITSKKNRGAWQGVSYETNKPKDVLYEQFKITSVADISQVGNNSEPAPKEEPSLPPSGDLSSPRPAPATPVPTPNGEAHELTAEKLVYATARTHLLCFTFVRDQYKALPPETWPALAATIFITAKDSGAVGKMINELYGGGPKKSPDTAGLGAPPTTEQIDPKNWRKAICPSGSPDVLNKELGKIDETILYDMYKFLFNKKEKTEKPLTAFGECVFEMAKDLGFIKKHEQEIWDAENPGAVDGKKMPEPEDSDIPF
jgi:hypothetical protein